MIRAWLGAALALVVSGCACPPAAREPGPALPAAPAATAAPAPLPAPAAPAGPPAPPAPAEPASLPDGAACSSASSCASGICEGEGCGAEGGRCAARDRPCTRDLRPYCGCDGQTFTASGTCPGRQFAHRGECPR